MLTKFETKSARVKGSISNFSFVILFVHIHISRL